MSSQEEIELEKAYAKVKPRRPWANENFRTGSMRLAKDMLYTTASHQVPNAIGRSMRLKKTPLFMATAAGSAMLNIFIERSGQLFKTFDLTRSAPYDMGAFARYMTVGNRRMEFDKERSYNVADYFDIRERLKAEGNLPHHWELNFESIDEDSLGVTDTAVASLFGLYMVWQTVIGGPMSVDRLSHWWNVERNHELHKQLGHGYRYSERLFHGESVADVQKLYDKQFGKDHEESAYIPDHNFDPVAEADFAPANYGDIAAVQEAAKEAAEAAVEALIGGDG